eukprot:GHVQ01021526.1.p1 GENE.GHVQ01021526.1~~GHVQ01021526.1.p1  ORF type:complete len:1255 (-),score=263.96 GHVQ01021526.1:355-4119(-)
MTGERQQQQQQQLHDRLVGEENAPSGGMGSVLQWRPWCDIEQWLHQAEHLSTRERRIAVREIEKRSGAERGKAYRRRMAEIAKLEDRGLREEEEKEAQYSMEQWENFCAEYKHRRGEAEREAARFTEQQKTQQLLMVQTQCQLTQRERERHTSALDKEKSRIRSLSTSLTDRKRSFQAARITENYRAKMISQQASAKGSIEGRGLLEGHQTPQRTSTPTQQCRRPNSREQALDYSKTFFHAASWTHEGPTQALHPPLIPSPTHVDGSVNMPPSLQSQSRRSKTTDGRLKTPPHQSWDHGQRGSGQEATIMDKSAHEHLQSTVCPTRGYTPAGRRERGPLVGGAAGGGVSHDLQLSSLLLSRSSDDYPVSSTPMFGSRNSASLQSSLLSVCSPVFGTSSYRRECEDSRSSADTTGGGQMGVPVGWEHGRRSERNLRGDGGDEGRQQTKTPKERPHRRGNPEPSENMEWKEIDGSDKVKEELVKNLSRGGGRSVAVTYSSPTSSTPSADCPAAIRLVLSDDELRHTAYQTTETRREPIKQQTTQPATTTTPKHTNNRHDCDDQDRSTYPHTTIDTDQDYQPSRLFCEPATREVPYAARRTFPPLTLCADGTMPGGGRGAERGRQIWGGAVGVAVHPSAEEVARGELSGEFVLPVPVVGKEEMSAEMVAAAAERGKRALDVELGNRAFAELEKQLQQLHDAETRQKIRTCHITSANKAQASCQRRKKSPAKAVSSQPPPCHSNPTTSRRVWVTDVRKFRAELGRAMEENADLIAVMNSKGSHNIPNNITTPNTNRGAPLVQCSTKVSSNNITNCPDTHLFTSTTTSTGTQSRSTLPTASHFTPSFAAEQVTESEDVPYTTTRTTYSTSPLRAAVDSSAPPSAPLVGVASLCPGGSRRDISATVGNNDSYAGTLLCRREPCPPGSGTATDNVVDNTGHRCLVEQVRNAVPAARPPAPCSRGTARQGWERLVESFLGDSFLDTMTEIPELSLSHQQLLLSMRGDGSVSESVEAALNEYCEKPRLGNVLTGSAVERIQTSHTDDSATSLHSAPTAPAPHAKAPFCLSHMVTKKNPAEGTSSGESNSGDPPEMLSAVLERQSHSLVERLRNRQRELSCRASPRHTIIREGRTSHTKPRLETDHSDEFRMDEMEQRLPLTSKRHDDVHTRSDAAMCDIGCLAGEDNRSMADDKQLTGRRTEQVADSNIASIGSGGCCRKQKKSGAQRKIDILTRRRTVFESYSFRSNARQKQVSHRPVCHRL